MGITSDSVVAIIFFLLPGYLALRAFEWQVAGARRSTFDEVVWALLFSIVGAVPLVVWSTSRALIEHLWQPTTLSPDAFVGVSLHVVSAIMLALIVAFLVRKLERANITESSIYSHGWDALWAPIAMQHRNICVELHAGIYSGKLVFADRGQVGRDLILRDPSRWDDQTHRFAPTGAEVMYITGDSITSVQVSSPYKEGSSRCRTTRAVSKQPAGP